ncbi:hypothetical protein KKF83_02730 [Patescibacteria group bacterium]|nr:hypothetical protein [Patescibacteria group bacterium]
MPDYLSQLNQQRAQNKPKKKPKKVTETSVEVSIVEFMIMGFIALIADLLGALGSPLALVIIFWYVIKFGKFPTGKFIGAGLAEIVSFGFLPGWSGFMIMVIIEQTGYMPNWIGKLTKAKI